MGTPIQNYFCRVNAWTIACAQLLEQQKDLLGMGEQIIADASETAREQHDFWRGRISSTEQDRQETQFHKAQTHVKEKIKTLKRSIEAVESPSKQLQEKQDCRERSSEELTPKIKRFRADSKEKQALSFLSAPKSVENDGVMLEQMLSSIAMDVDDTPMIESNDPLPDFQERKGGDCIKAAFDWEKEWGLKLESFQATFSSREAEVLREQMLSSGKALLGRIESTPSSSQMATILGTLFCQVYQVVEEIPKAASLSALVEKLNSMSELTLNAISFNNTENKEFDSSLKQLEEYLVTNRWCPSKPFNQLSTLSSEELGFLDELTKWIEDSQDKLFEFMCSGVLKKESALSEMRKHFIEQGEIILACAASVEKENSTEYSTFLHEFYKELNAMKEDSVADAAALDGVDAIAERFNRLQGKISALQKISSITSLSGIASEEEDLLKAPLPFFLTDEVVTWASGWGLILSQLSSDVSIPDQYLHQLKENVYKQGIEIADQFLDNQPHSSGGEILNPLLECLAQIEEMVISSENAVEKGREVCEMLAALEAQAKIRRVPGA